MRAYPSADGCTPSTVTLVRVLPPVRGHERGMVVDHDQSLFLAVRLNPLIELGNAPTPAADGSAQGQVPGCELRL
jgi:hypothetical protein